MPGFKGAKPIKYGPDHKRARAAAFARLPDWSPCCRCGALMWKHAKDRTGKSALHFDHTDDRSSYRGFSHKACNERAGASKGGRLANAATKQTKRTTWRSRTW